MADVQQQKTSIDDDEFCHEFVVFQGNDTDSGDLAILLGSARVMLYLA
jgi:hypothetical protein